MEAYWQLIVLYYHQKSYNQRATDWAREAQPYAKVVVSQQELQFSKINNIEYYILNLRLDGSHGG